MIYSKHLEAEAMEEEGDEEDFLHLLKLIEFYSLTKNQRKKRSPIPRNQSPIPIERLRWSTFARAQMARDPKDFVKSIRMPLEAFEALHEILEEFLSKNEEMGALRGGVIASELRLYVTIRFLAGGSMHDIRRLFDIPRSTSYDLVREVCQAIVDCDKLRFCFPRTEEECQKAALGFRSISFDEAIVNCVAAVDGYLLHIEQPSKKIAGNQRQYYSGHYKKFGINVQAACDHNSMFVYFALAGPGSQNDKVAIDQCSLGPAIDNLPDGYCAIGDAAYHPTERMVPIFYGVNRDDPLHDNFNFFASQLRIRIEMAFGLMQMKWRFLQQARQPTKNLRTRVMAIARLHNYVVKYRLEQGDALSQMMTEDHGHPDGESGQTSALPSQPVDENGNPMLYDDNGNVVRRPLPKGHSMTRHSMAVRIQEKKLVRPLRNTIQRDDESDEVDEDE